MITDPLGWSGAYLPGGLRWSDRLPHLWRGALGT